MKISIYTIRHLENITRQALSPVTRIFRTCPKCSLSACGGGSQESVKPGTERAEGTPSVHVSARNVCKRGGNPGR
jgi:hypothetical protein